MKKIFENKKNVIIGLIALALIIFALNFIQEQFAIKDYQKRFQEAPVGSFVQTGNMKLPRAGHSSFKLNDGRVLIVGGNKGAEIFDPKTGQFKLINRKLKYFTTNQNSLVLNNGDVFVGGSYIFNPKTQKFKTIDESYEYASSSVLLPDGNIFIKNHINNDLSYYYIYNQQTNKLEKYNKKLPKMFEESVILKFVNLNNDKIFVAGDAPADKNFTDYRFTQFYIWDYKTNRFTYIGKKDLEVPFLTLTLLNKDKVLITGGRAKKRNPLIYDAITNKFTETAKPNFIRAGITRTIALSNGNILIVGGEYKPTKTYENSLYDDMYIEIYNTKTNKFFLKAKTPRRFLPMYADPINFAVVELDDGNILISGGGEYIIYPLNSCLIYKLGDKTYDKNN